jgi:polyphosphate glucokinase
MTATLALGIDIGGTGIKGALVDLPNGTLLGERLRLLTPQPATPAAVAEVVAEIVEQFATQVPQNTFAEVPLGVTIPGVVVHGVVRTAANISAEWLNCPAEQFLADRLERSVTLLNDADAAGLAEAQFGAAQDQTGLTVLCTLGTGIGSALLLNGTLVPNSELGHLKLAGQIAEQYASGAVRENLELSWTEWARRLHEYFRTVEDLLWPELFIVGGGISRKAEKFLPLLDLRTPIVAAQLLNHAGIIGAGYWAAQQSH